MDLFREFRMDWDLPEAELGEPRKTHAVALEAGQLWLDAQSQEARNAIVRDRGFRFNAFSMLGYYDLVRSVAPDSMHSVLEGTCGLSSTSFRLQLFFLLIGLLLVALKS